MVAETLSPDASSLHIESVSARVRHDPYTLQHQKDTDNVAHRVDAYGDYHVTTTQAPGMVAAGYPTPHDVINKVPKHRRPQVPKVRGSSAQARSGSKQRRAAANNDVIKSRAVQSARDADRRSSLIGAKETSTPRSAISESGAMFQQSSANEAVHQHRSPASGYTQFSGADRPSRHADRLQESALHNVHFDSSDGDVNSSRDSSDTAAHDRPTVVPPLQLRADSGNEKSAMDLSVELMPPSAFMLKHGDTPRTEISTISCPVSNLSSTIHHLNEHTMTSATTAFGTGGMRETQHALRHHFATNQNTTWFQSPSEELLYIKEQLEQYKSNKEKLTLAREQFAHLSKWLSAQQSDSDPDVILVKEEAHLLQNEITELRSIVQNLKPEVKILTERAKRLTRH